MSASTAAWPGIAPVDGLSQVCGSANAPLSTTTVPGLLAEAPARWPDRPAVVFREQGVHWTWARFAAEVDRFAAGLAALGLARGDRLGIWSPNRVEWLITQFATARIGVILVNINPAYRLAELEYALDASGCRAIVSAERLRDSMYLEMLQALAPELGASEPGRLTAQRLPMLHIVIRLGQERTPGMLGWDEVTERGGSTLDIATLDAATAALDCHDAINIQFTSGTTGNPKGATLTPPQHRQQRALRGAGDAPRPSTTRCAYRCRSTTASAWCCRCWPASRRARRWCSRARCSTPARRWRRWHGRALHGAARRADDVHRRARPSATSAALDLTTLRTGIMAGAPCPIETMKRVVVADAPGRGDHRLRHDRDQPGVVPELDRRPARAPRLDRRPHPAASGGQGGRRRRRGAAGRPAGRAVGARLLGDARLLGRRGAHPRGGRPTAGCTPATWRRSTPRATATSSAASRTC